MLTRSAIVHIGLEKTGSTAIQRWLAENRQALQASGVLMPASIGFPNHTKLVSACLDDGVVDNLKSHHLYAAGLSEQQFRRAIFTGLHDEIRRERSPWHTLLITSELISSRLSLRSEIERLVDQLRCHVDRIRFVVFLRRQDHLALSRFSSILRSGHTGFDDLFVDYSPSNFVRVPDQRPLSDDLFFYDFEAIISRFEAVANAEVSVYFYGSDRPLEVFSSLLHLDASLCLEPGGRHNSAMSVEAQYLIANLNQTYPVQFVSGARNEPYRRLQRSIEREVTGQSRSVSRLDAMDFLSRYAAINQRIEQRYGQPRGHGFPTGFSPYPESIDLAGIPALMAERLSDYRSIAQAQVPEVEPLSGRLYNRLRRAKASLKRATRAFTSR